MYPDEGVGAGRTSGLGRDSSHTLLVCTAARVSLLPLFRCNSRVPLILSLTHFTRTLYDIDIKAHLCYGYVSIRISGVRGHWQGIHCWVSQQKRGNSWCVILRE